ncbi:MAG: 3-hydroxybutyrate dehydrogenase [Clostridiales bacterium]|nr:3-hydroxybutyrate dehydrogenase [Clostridiales bacterium]
MIKGKVALITGGASGIGKAITTRMCKEGAKVVIADINAEGVKKVCEELGCEGKAVDLSTREGCKVIVDYAVEKFGRVDILGNIAGIQHVCPIDQFPEDKWDFMIRLMLTAPFLLTKYCWPYMKENGWGRIVNLSSIHGLVASEFKSCYVTAKHGLFGMTKTAALEGGPLGITVNCICPAYVMTPLVEGQIADQAKTHNIPEEKVISDIMLSKAAIKKMLDPSTVADVFVFLCSDAAESITGISLPIDGGWTAN